MDEYISREALLAVIAADYGNWTVCNDTDESYRQGVKDNYNDTIRLINDIPAADVQPVKHGRWIVSHTQKHVEVTYECSECQHEVVGEYEKTPFCGGCGVRMDGDCE